MNLSRSSNLKILQAQVLRTRSWKPPLPPPKRKCVDWQPSGKKIHHLMHMQVRSASNSLTLTHQPCKPERPTTQSSRSSLQVWWAKVQEYEPSCVPKMNRGAWFLLLILDWFSSSNRKLRINPKKRSGDQPWDKGPPNFLQAQPQVQAIGLEINLRTYGAV